MSVVGITEFSHDTHHKIRETGEFCPGCSGTLEGMKNFASIYSHGFVRVAACTLPVYPVHPGENATAILEAVRHCEGEGVALAAFPELSLTGYAIDDLLLQDTLIDEVYEAIEALRAGSEGVATAFVVGAPLHHGNRLYNCGVVIHDGAVLGAVPKTYIPNYREFYEKRHFASGEDVMGGHIQIPFLGVKGVKEERNLESEFVPFGTDLLFEATNIEGFTFHVEVCEDMWVPVPPSATAALAGATVLVNLSASPDSVGRPDERASLVKAASMRYCGAYIYAASGEGESSTDLVWDGHAMIYEMGEELASSRRFDRRFQATITDIDLRSILQERIRHASFDDNRRVLGLRRALRGEVSSSHNAFRTIFFTPSLPEGDIGLRREVARFPFFSTQSDDLSTQCCEAYQIQIHSLTQRLKAIGNPKIVIGVSGGLDSTQALIVAAKAMDLLGRPRSDILAYTMPGFATSDHTKENATRLSTLLGTTFEEIDIRPAARQMLADMDHPFASGKPVYDVTFENVQAGLRTDFLFRLANAKGGIVLGTGDLSELALGWCTFGVGDHMSHYNVNPGIPKSFMQYLISWMAHTDQFSSEVNEVLLSILDTEISPELVPGAEGEIQSTQSTIGPYELHDFTLYYLLRYGMRPSDIAFLAWHAWKDSERGTWPMNISESERHTYTLPEITHWMETFLRRFFSQQFKRSTAPNGPKVLGGGTLSPRGDWRMPSDTSGAIWLKDLSCVPTHLEGEE